MEGLQLVFDRSLVTSMQPRSFVNQMRDAVADCDDGSSEDGMMLLSMPHDIPEVTFPVLEETRDEETPAVITRRLTPANRPLQLLEAGRLGAFATEHLPSRPAVPDLYRQLQSAVGVGSSSVGPTVATHRRRDLPVAGG